MYQKAIPYVEWVGRFLKNIGYMYVYRLVHKKQLPLLLASLTRKGEEGHFDGCNTKFFLLKPPKVLPL